MHDLIPALAALLGVMTLIFCLLALVGLIRPRWVRRKTRVGAVFGYLGLALLTLLVGAAVLPPEPPEARAEREARAAARAQAIAAAKQAARDEAARAQAEADAECARGIRCWGERHQTIAGIDCQRAIEQQITTAHQWTDGIIEPKFSHYRYLNYPARTLTYLGDRLQVQNVFGAWINMHYACDYDPATEAVLAIRIEPGRLPVTP